MARGPSVFARAASLPAFGRAIWIGERRVWVVQRRPVVGDQGQRCVVERSFESVLTAMDRMAAVGRRPFGGQGRPEAAGHERRLLGASRRPRKITVRRGARVPTT